MRIVTRWEWKPAFWNKRDQGVNPHEFTITYHLRGIQSTVIVLWSPFFASDDLHWAAQRSASSSSSSSSSWIIFSHLEINNLLQKIQFENKIRSSMKAGWWFCYQMWLNWKEPIKKVACWQARFVIRVCDVSRVGHD